MTTTDDQARWFSVRCLLASGKMAGNTTRMYEERITMWLARSQSQAIDLAEVEGRNYASRFPEHPDVYLGFAQCYELLEAPRHGAEIFSLIRDSELDPRRYLDGFFDTGTEHQSGRRPTLGHE